MAEAGEEDFSKEENLNILCTSQSSVVQDTYKSKTQIARPCASCSSNTTCVFTGRATASCNNPVTCASTSTTSSINYTYPEASSSACSVPTSGYGNTTNVCSFTPSSHSNGQRNEAIEKRVLYPSAESSQADCGLFGSVEKKTKLHLNWHGCLEYSKTPEGSKALNEPLAVVRSSCDKNMGLYPKPSKYKKKKSRNPQSHGTSYERTFTKKRKSLQHNSQSSPQKDFMINYAEVNSKPVNDDQDMVFSFENKPVMETFTSTPEKSPTSSQSQRGTTSKMFSPMKQIRGTSIYKVDSSSESSEESDSEWANFEMSDQDLMDCVDKYGLLGSGNYPRDPDANRNFFECLPVHIIENIFCYMPMLDMCLSANRVCHSWNSIISDPKFLPWKKKYFMLSKGHGTVYGDMNNFLRDNQMRKESDYLPGLIRYMHSDKHLLAENALECLKKHPKYTWAVALMEERFKDLYVNEEPHPGCIMAIIVIVTDNVKDISEMINLLVSPMSRIRTALVIDTLYQMATFLRILKMRNSGGIWSSMHYRLYCGLYLFENTYYGGSISSPGRGKKKAAVMSSCLKKGHSLLHLTNEQLRICHYDVHFGETIKIVAFAGTGKTSTLVAYAQMRPKMNFLLVVFNKSVQTHANKIFPPNVTCKTGHSLAFGEVGARFSAAGKIGPEMNAFDVSELLPLRSGENKFARARRVLETLKKYLASADHDITLDHSPSEVIDDASGENVSIDSGFRENYVIDAKLLWRKMKDVSCKRVKMTHDGYLKLYQLSQPKLCNYDCILIDEAQDLTPAITDIMLSQKQAKIFVGDPHQQIYSFRGAVNALNNIQASKVFYLTQSFRFGPEIARTATGVLERLKGETKCLVGCDKEDTVRGDHIEGQIAVISRTNFGLFSEAVKKCLDPEVQTKIYIIGGLESFGLPMIEEIYTLMLSPNQRIREGRTITNKLLKKIPNIAALEYYATKTLDADLRAKIKIARTFSNNLPWCISVIKRRTVADPKDADIIYTTAHKAKGLEFTSVKIVNDFLNGSLYASTSASILCEGLDLSINLSESREPDDEYNLLYVALTRAQKYLQMCPLLCIILGSVWFIYPVLSKQLKDEGMTFKPSVLTLVNKEICLSNEFFIPAEVYSPESMSVKRGSKFLSMWRGIAGEIPGKDQEKKRKNANPGNTKE